MPTIRVLKAVPSSGKTRNDFWWPESGPVECPDWNESKMCGGGLHAWIWHQTKTTEPFPITPGTTYRVIEVDAGPSNLVYLDEKIKFRRGHIIGAYPTIPEAVEKGGLQLEPCTAGFYGTATAGNYGTATAGDYGTATAGVRSTATTRDHGTATTGTYGTATAGYYGTATAGDFGTATVGYYGTATVGACGIAVAGDYGTSTAGFQGNAIAGDYGTATAGAYGTATAKYHGTAIAGNDGIATAGVGGKVCAGRSGVLILFDGNGKRFIAKVGAQILANQFYEISNGKFKKYEG